MQQTPLPLPRRQPGMLRRWPRILLVLLNTPQSRGSCGQGPRPSLSFPTAVDCTGGKGRTCSLEPTEVPLARPRRSSSGVPPPCSQRGGGDKGAAERGAGLQTSTWGCELQALVAADVAAWPALQLFGPEGRGRVPKVLEEEPAAAAAPARLAVAPHSLQLPHHGLPLLLVCRLPAPRRRRGQALQRLQVCLRVVEQAVRRLAVSPGPSALLVVGAERFGRARVHHEPHVRLVHAHAEGNGRHENAHRSLPARSPAGGGGEAAPAAGRGRGAAGAESWKRRAQERRKGALALLLGEAGMVGERLNSPRPEQLRQMLAIALSMAVNDASIPLARPLGHQVQQLRLRVPPQRRQHVLLDDLVVQVRPVKWPHNTQW
mmetsp:Transcript_67761/g.198295  ORF Transcript_67761/g.198295 Transcript_67761/m.198295 type:complete len:374 (-) Transcript_67761:192-1313(-)